MQRMDSLGSGSGASRRGSEQMLKMTVQELRQFDGTSESGKLFVALKGKVYEINEEGKKFYMPGAPYACFAGRDASRGLAKMNTEEVQDTYDPLDDLSETEQASLERWVQQFSGKYKVVAELMQ